jgi:hypothetical protein
VREHAFRPRDPARRNYVLWRQQRLFELWRLWDAEIRKINPGARFIANAGGGAMSELDMKTIGELASTLFADRQARRGLAAPWTNGKNAKEYRATLGGKPIGGIFSVGVEEPYRWKDSVQSEAEIRIFVADGIANGFRPWFTKFSGTLRDRRWLLEGDGKFYDCGNARDGKGYKDVTNSRDPDALAARKRFDAILTRLPAGPTVAEAQPRGRERGRKKKATR